MVLDEVTLPTAVLGRSVPVDPGPHTVRVRRGGVDVTMEEFRAGEGQTMRIPLTAPANTMITPEATAAAGLQPSSTTAEPMAPPAEEREESGGVSPAVWVVGALVIAAGLGVGAYFLFRGEERAPFESPNAIGDGIIRF